MKHPFAVPVEEKRGDQGEAELDGVAPDIAEDRGELSDPRLGPGGELGPQRGRVAAERIKEPLQFLLPLGV